MRRYRTVLRLFLAALLSLSSGELAARRAAGMPATSGEPDWRRTVEQLPRYTRPAERPGTDWLIDPSPFKARLCRGEHRDELVLTNGLIARVLRLAPNAATIALDNLMTGESILRAVKPEASVTIDGRPHRIGGLLGQANAAFLRPEWVDALGADPAALVLSGLGHGPIRERLAWKRTRHHAPGAAWPPPGIELRMDYSLPGAGGAFTVSVHYELYDGLPCYSKWLTVTSTSAAPIRLDRFSSEMLAAVEYTSEVDQLSIGLTTPSMHIETEMAFGGTTAQSAGRRSYRWIADPEYQTQVNYERQTPCLLDVGPDLGPAQVIAPGETFESFRTWVIPFDSDDRERRGLSLRRFYRALAPWVTENPLMMHVRYADEKTVTSAIDQCAEVGFEMVILTFGSGFDLENPDPATLETARKYASYARERGIEIGSYSLLASRRIDATNDVVMPAGQTPAFGNSPCLCSAWGERYFTQLHEFHRASGFTLLEHDGSYPGDPCASEGHPGHRSLADSRWNQWRAIRGFYRWCRGEGISLNVPDFYFLTGSTKAPMGYRETNWSLPRDDQVIHTRQNIYDGTWQKTPSMGWMFVPLTEYQGGGAAATIEPLDEHLDHYERMLSTNLALGVQACYRGPRLYDTPRTREMVARWVAWYKQHRDILECDLIHGRRADARDVDWMLHVSPTLPVRGMLVAFNPLGTPVERTIRVNVYYTGLHGSMTSTDADGHAATLPISAEHIVECPITIPARSMTWRVFTTAGTSN